MVREEQYSEVFVLSFMLTFLEGVRQREVQYSEVFVLSFMLTFLEGASHRV